MGKKFIVWLLVVSMFITSVDLTVFAANEEQGQIDEQESSEEAGIFASDEALEESEQENSLNGETEKEEFIPENEETEIEYNAGDGSFDGGTAGDATSGTCGDNLTWEFSNGTLTISGTGEMYDYDYSNAPSPWRDFNLDRVVILNGVESIGDT